MESIPVENILHWFAQIVISATQQDKRKLTNAILNILINLPTCCLNICIRLNWNSSRKRSLHVCINILRWFQIFLKVRLIYWQYTKRRNDEDQSCQLRIRIAIDRSNIYLLKFSRHIYRARCDRLSLKMQKNQGQHFPFFSCVTPHEGWCCQFCPILRGIYWVLGK